MKNLKKSKKQLLAEIDNLKQYIKKLEGTASSCADKSSIDNNIIQQQKQFILDNIYDIAWLKDKESRYVVVNKAFGNVSGMKANDLLGKTDFDIWPKELAKKYRADDKEIMLTGKRKLIEETLIDKQGRVFTLETAKSPFYDDKGVVMGTVGIAHNITKRKKAKLELHNLNILLTSIIENIPNMIFLKDARELRFVRFNRAGEKLLGYKRAELLGKNDYDFFTKEQADFFIKKDREVLRHKKVVDVPEEPIQTLRKGKRILHTKKVPILGKNGKPEYLLGISDDITEYKKAYVEISELKKAKKALKESETRYRVLFESANDAIFLADADTGILVGANKSAAKLLGRPVNEIIGMHQKHLHPESDKELYEGLFKSHINARKPFMRTAFVVHKSGRSIPVYISANHITLNGRKIVMGIFSDITALKQIEDGLKRDKNSLESIVARKRKDLSSVLKSLEDSKRLADIGALAAMVAHELRNPLGVIKTAVYNITRKLEAPYVKNIKSHVNNIDKKIFEADRIISSLLSYSKTLTLFYEKLLIFKLIDQGVNNFRQNHNNPKIKLIVDYVPVKDIWIKADSVQIASVLSNVLDNAYQALPGNTGRIDLICRYHEKEKAISIVVRDNGSGLSKENLSRVFDPFFSLRTKGIGLGLTVCKQIVTLHNGTIDMQSEKSKGTTVKIILPVNIK
ncbi:PAS domain-containing sensor histidine kinase [bacterium]|nr:MAG: PAS domain-containing sensor histidine kinase [bacterium]